MEMRPELAQAVIDTSLAEAKQYLLAASTAKELSAVPTETVVLYGPAAMSILAVAHSSGADLIVLCSHGYSGITRWVLGSVAEKVAHHAAVPVLVLREGGPVPAAPHPDATLRALVALDGSAHAKAALEPAALLIAALAAPAAGALHLVRVVKPVSAGREAKDLEHREIDEQVLHKAKQYLSSTVDHLQGRAYRPRCSRPQPHHHLVGRGRYRCSSCPCQTGRERGRRRGSRSVRRLRRDRHGNAWL